MDKKLEKFLAGNKIKYELHEHKKIFTAHDEAQTQHIKIKEIAKVVLVKITPSPPASQARALRAGTSLFAKEGGKYALVVIPAQKYVDFKKVKKGLKVKKVSMAKESDITKILKTRVGLIHPFGNLYELPVLLDNYLGKQKKLMASAGSYTESIELKVRDFIKLAQPIKGAFSK